MTTEAAHKIFSCAKERVYRLTKLSSLKKKRPKNGEDRVEEYLDEIVQALQLDHLIEPVLGEYSLQSSLTTINANPHN